MSEKRAAGQRYTPDEVEALYARYSVEKVEALVAEADALADEYDTLVASAATSAEDDPDEGSKDEQGSEGDDPDQDDDPEDLLGGGSYVGLRVDELRDLLASRGLPTDGRKAELRDRLRAADTAAQ